MQKVILSIKDILISNCKSCCNKLKGIFKVEFFGNCKSNKYEIDLQCFNNFIVI